MHRIKGICFTLLLFGLFSCNSRSSLPEPDGTFLTTLAGLSLSQSEEQLFMYMPPGFKMYKSWHADSQVKDDLVFLYESPRTEVMVEDVDVSYAHVRVEVRRRAPDSDMITNTYPLGTFVTMTIGNKERGQQLLDALKARGYEVAGTKGTQELLEKEGYPGLIWSAYDAQKAGHSGNTFRWTFQFSYFHNTSKFS